MASTSDLTSTNTTKNKNSVSETGHAKNIANFQDLISFCQGYGANYNPTKESLKIPQLQALYQLAQDKLNATKTQKTTFDNATNERRNTFANLKPLATKIINAFAVSGADTLAIADAKTVNKKLQGTTSKKSTTTNDNIPPLGELKGASTSQQSYDRLIDHFVNLIQVVEQNTNYTPNETELQVATLQTKLEEMQTKNTNLINAYTGYSNAMIERNQTLYNPLTGLVQTSKEVKQYVKSVFGANSPQYKQVSGLEFKVIKKD
ncbi:hypothetical protein [Flavobacterium croceum]|uniref:Uncharacterized protein n=1 Tax=Flavobacterium croceum DSM 17960 TaxID=1121886 RepID=A0A2S4NAP3_9FLAO|nr:hypothetical protein [Flavobacterium croceum]POS02513.1 hypothetical protein Q361_10319 [Flavobacterium croceum DSM 17960]